ncbi:MAG: methyltransferase domain-containing protein [Chloroflexota bacterium]
MTELLLRGLPGSSVTAVELDQAMIDVAAGRLARMGGAVGRFAIARQSIMNTDLPDEAFDFALARYVFQHLAAPDMAVEEILRLLKPGGRLAIIDVDDRIGGMMDPPIDGLAAVVEGVRRAQAVRAGNRDLGRALWRMLEGNGFEELALDVVAAHSDELGLDVFLPQLHPDRFLPFVLPEGLTQADWQRYRDGYAAFVASPSPFVMVLILIVSGRKPPVA